MGASTANVDGLREMSADWRLQATVFAEQLRRTHLPQALSAGDAGRFLRIGVVRNDACEPTLGLASRFAAYVGIALEWAVGPYDDGLQAPVEWRLSDGSPLPVGIAPDALVVWVDWRRLDPKGHELVRHRLERLRDRFDQPIAVVMPSPVESETWARLLAAWVASFGMTAIELPTAGSIESLRDPRLVRVAGSDLSGEASLHLARSLGVTFAATVAYPPLKLMAIDLDNTLHAGVLGEDGVGNVVVTQAHRRLGEHLRRLRRAGLLLALVSKNDPQDVGLLFDARTDLAMALDDFIAVEASWQGKVQTIQALAASLGISLDACALLDDNPGELAAAALHGVWAINSQDPDQAIRVLELLPRMSASDDHSQTRENDLRSRAERLALIDELDPRELHASLGTRLEVRVDAAVDLDRTADLLARTNQFNCTLARTPRAALGRLLASEQVRIATIRVSDRLADSGVVGVLVLNRPGVDGTWTIREFVLSCRILGRGLEGALLAAMAQGATGEQFPALNLAIVEGPRNEPVRRWAEMAVHDGRVAPWRSVDLDLLLACGLR